MLGGEDGSTTQDVVHTHRPSAEKDTWMKPRLTLRDVLSNPSSLSYFMEFMDRRHRSLLVQFWLTVESFKNPLESIESGSSGDEDEPIQDQSSSNNVREDISMINDLYFSASPLPPALSSISEKHVEIIRSFARDELSPSPGMERRVRRSVMLAQRQVERDMEHDFEDFENSELWFRVVGDRESASGGGGGGDCNSSRREVNTFSPTSGVVRRTSTSASVSPPTSTHRQFRFSAPQFLPRPETSPLNSSLQLERSRSSRSGSSSPNQPSVEIRRSSSPKFTLSNIDVLMSPVADEPSERSRAPLFDDPDDRQPQSVDEAQRMEAIQAALTDIMAYEKQTETLRAVDVDPTDDQNPVFGAARSTRARKGNVFDDLHEGDDDDEADDEYDDRPRGSEPSSFQLAAPGDLQLSYEIARLGSKISDLQSQDMMLDTLIKKAELTGDNQELKLLQKSKSSMSRELRELQFQKAQYEQQESANRLLSDRTKVTIISSTVGEEDGKSVVRYLTQIQQLAPDGTFTSGWVVARRYNEFLNMHNKLRERYALVRNLDFPGKRLVTALSGSFVDNRRAALEKYLQVCRF